VGLLGTLKNLGGGFWEVVPYFDEEKPLTFHVNQVLYRDRIRMFDSKHPKHLIWRWQLGELASDNSRKNPRRRNPDYDEQIRRANSEWVNVDVMSASELVGPDYFFAWTERGVSPQRMLEVINAAVLLRANALAKGRLRDAERTGYIPSEEEAIELVEALQERVAEQYGVSWLRFRVAEILEDLPEGQPVHGPLGEELGKLKARGARRIMHGYGRARRNG
jgi:hypothetical protein